LASLGNLYLGGFEGKKQAQIIFESGVSFFLDKESEINKEIIFNNSVCEVEVESRNNVIVARYKYQLSKEKLLEMGLEDCQKALDLISVVDNKFYRLELPDLNHIIVSKINNDFILRYIYCSPLAVEGKIEFKRIDSNGKEISQPVKPEIKWNQFFRYFRLSQTSKDLIEAYRSLWLGFEYFLNTQWQKKENEGERKWLKRALCQLNMIIPLKGFVTPVSNNIIDDFFNFQYEKIRCYLFHSKFQSPTQKTLDNNELEMAYDQLLRLWKKIAQKFFNLSGSGFAYTFSGFKALMSKAFNHGYQFCATEDPTVLSKDETKISPKNYPIIYTQVSELVEEVKPGYIQLKGKFKDYDFQQIKSIHRICNYIPLKSILFSYSYFSQGLNLSGINSFEVSEIIRLINKNLPQVKFLY